MFASLCSLRAKYSGITVRVFHVEGSQYASTRPSFFKGFMLKVRPGFAGTWSYSYCIMPDSCGI